MSKITQLLQETGAQVQVSTLKELFNKLFASDKDASINKDFWTAEQWEKGISGIPTSSPGAEGEEHWFQVDLFNPLILKIDSKYKTLIEKIEAFVEHVKTVDTNFVTESDPLDDDTLLKRCYETLYQHALRSDFSNLDNPKPHHITKLIDKLGIQSKFVSKIQNPLMRNAHKKALVQNISANYEIKNGETVAQSGAFPEINTSIIELADKFFEYQIVLGKKSISISSESSPKSLTFLLKLKGIAHAAIRSFSGKLQFLQTPVDTNSYIEGKVFSVNLKDPNDEIEISVPMYVERTTSHTHTLYSPSARQAGEFLTGSPNHVSSSSYYSVYRLNPRLLQAFGLSDSVSEYGIASATYDYNNYTTSSYPGYNNLAIQAIILKGVLCLT